MKRSKSARIVVHKNKRKVRLDLIVIGASMGGFQALRTIINELPKDLPAAVLVVLHIQPEATSLLAEIFGGQAQIKVVHATDGEKIKRGCVYVAVPDFHLRIVRDKIFLDHGPRHNFSRPAIDPLFYSAASQYASRVIGVVLTGALDDGTAGLLSIERQGGVTVVQDPEDAVNPSMPASALRCVSVDYCVPLAEIGRLLISLAGKPALPFEHRKKRKLPEPSHPKLSTHICPECNGPMWIVTDGKLLHFHCRIGHSFSGQSLYVEKTMAIESALWSAVNALKDKADVAEKLSVRLGKSGAARLSSEYYSHQASVSSEYAEIIKKILLSSSSPTMIGKKR